MDNIKQFLEIRDNILNADPHMRKFVEGNKSAGKRVRKILQEVVKNIKVLRREIAEQNRGYKIPRKGSPQ